MNVADFRVVTLSGDAGAENYGCDQGAVYMANAVSASGFGISDDGHEQLIAEDGNDLSRAGAGMDQQSTQISSFVAMQQAMTNGFTQAAEMMEDNLGRCA